MFGHLHDLLLTVNCFIIYDFKIIMDIIDCYYGYMKLLRDSHFKNIFLKFLRFWAYIYYTFLLLLYIFISYNELFTICAKLEKPVNANCISSQVNELFRTNCVRVIPPPKSEGFRNGEPISSHDFIFLFYNLKLSNLLMLYINYYRL